MGREPLESLLPRSDVEAAVARVFAPHLIGGGSGDAGTPAGSDGVGDDLTRLWRAWRRTLRMLRPLGAVSLGNRVEVFADGDAVFRAMWKAIEEAEHEVLMTTYILEPDRVGRRTLALLSAAAHRGCQVTLVYDSFGSSRLREELVQPLRTAGAQVVSYNPMLRLITPMSRLVRNHQKILVVDGKLGFAGGMNVGEDYAGEEFGNGRFRDTHLRLTGPCVRELGHMVTRAIGDAQVEDPGAERAEGQHVDDEPGESEVGAGAPDVIGASDAPGASSGCMVQILESNIRRHHRAIQRALRMTVGRAVERCFLTTPYFVPPRRLVGSLLRAARRGVDVRILTAGRSDAPWVRQASQHIYGRFLRAGVRIFEYEGATLHAKTMTIDGVYAVVGSFNLDYWSDRRNLEVNVSFLNRERAGEIEQAFRADLPESREVKLEEWKRRTLWQRVKNWVAYQLLSL